MRLRFVLCALPAVFAAAGVLVSPASPLTKQQTFSVLSVDSGIETPIGGFAFDREPVPGDRFGFVDYLHKWAGTKRGARIGRLEGLCTFTRISLSGGLHASAHCDA